MKFEQKRYRAWIDSYFYFFPIKSIITVSIISGVIIYLIGLILSAIGDFLFFS